MTWGSAPGIPAGGYVNVIAADPANAGRFLAGGDVFGLQETLDYGVTWDRINTGLFTGKEFGIADILFDPADATKVYAAAGVQTGGGYFLRSLDGGHTWSAINTTDVDFAGQGNIGGAGPRSTVRLIGKRANATHLYAGCFAVNGLVHSVDGGLTWPTQIGLGGRHIRCIAMDPTTTSSHQTIWVGTYDDGGANYGLYSATECQSVPYTGTLTHVTTGGFTPRIVEDIFFIGTTMYLICNTYGIWKSESPYTTFAEITGALDKTVTQWCSVTGYRAGADQASDVLYVGSNLSLPFSTPVNVVTADAVNKVATVVCDNPHGEPVGGHVTIAGAGGYSGFWQVLSVPTVNSFTAYIGTTPGHVTTGTVQGNIYNSMFKSVNGGASWSCLTCNPATILNTIIGTAMDWYYKWAQNGSNDYYLGHKTDVASQILLDPNDTNKVFVVGHGGAFRSLDAGGHFAPCVNLMVGSGIPIIKLDPNNQLRVYCGNGDWGFHASHDGMLTSFQSVPVIDGFPNPGGIAIDPVDGMVYLTGGDPVGATPSCFNHSDPTTAKGYNLGVPWVDEGFNTGVSAFSSQSLDVGRSATNQKILVLASRGGGAFRSVAGVWGQIITAGTGFGAGVLKGMNKVVSWPRDGTGVVLLYASDTGLFRSLSYGASPSVIWALTCAVQCQLLYGPNGRAYLLTDATTYRIDDILNPAKNQVVTSNPTASQFLATDLGKNFVQMAVSPNGLFVWGAIQGTSEVVPSLLYLSQDFGASWTLMNDAPWLAFSGNQIQTMEADDLGTLYLGSSGVGMSIRSPLVAPVGAGGWQW